MSDTTKDPTPESAKRTAVGLALMFAIMFTGIGGMVYWTTSEAAVAREDRKRNSIAQERQRDATCKAHPEQAKRSSLVSQACERAAAIGQYGEVAIATDLKLCEMTPAGSPFCKGVAEKAADLKRKTDDLMNGRRS